MLELTITEFKKDIIKYLQLAMTETISIKSREQVFEINSSKSKATSNTNPSPSNDPWFDVPENIAAMEEGAADIAAGRYRAYSDAELKELLGL